MMCETEAVGFFVSECLRHSRTLPLRESRAYLKGMLCLGGEQQEIDPLRSAYADVCALDDQLEKLQLKLTLK